MVRLDGAQSGTRAGVGEDEFRSFLAAVLLLPTQIIRTGRKIIYRILGYNGWLRDFFATWERLRRMETS